MTIAYDDFAKLELRVATIVEAKVHPNADKLLVIQVDLGGEKRQICAGIRAFYSPEQLVGKQVVVVANLEPRPLRGEGRLRNGGRGSREAGAHEESIPLPGRSLTKTR